MTARKIASKTGRPLAAVWAFMVRWKRWVLPLVSAVTLQVNLISLAINAKSAAQLASERRIAKLVRLKQARYAHVEITYAASRGDLATVQTIANSDPFLNQTGRPQDISPLFAATEGNHVAVVRFLLSRGVDVHGKDDAGETALHIARRKGFTEIVKLLVAAGAKQ